MNVTVLGKVGITPRGAWSAATADYEYLDTVTDGGNSYMVIYKIGLVPVGTLPTNGLYFQKIAEKGNTGWTPLIIEVSDGDNRVKQLSDYIGGTGDKPSLNVGKYIKADGTFTAVLSEAYNYGGKALLDKNTATGVGEIRMWTGTEEEFNAISAKDSSIIYIIR